MLMEQLMLKFIELGLERLSIRSTRLHLLLVEDN